MDKWRDKEEYEFRGTRLDFIGFLRSFADKRYFAGFAGRSPNFSIEYPTEESLIDHDTPYVKVLFFMQMNNYPIVSITAEKLSDDRTLLTGRILHVKYGNPLNMLDAGVADDWHVLIAELQKYGWVDGNGSENRKRIDRKRFLDKLNQHFGLEDLKTLCFELNLDYDDLPADGKENKFRELVLRLEREGSLSELVEIAQRHCPKVSWDEGVER